MAIADEVVVVENLLELVVVTIVEDVLELESPEENWLPVVVCTED